MELDESVLLTRSDAQGICGFRAWESDTAFLLCELHKLRGGDHVGWKGSIRSQSQPRDGVIDRSLPMVKIL